MVHGVCKIFSKLFLNEWMGLSYLGPAMHMQTCDRRGQKRAAWAVNQTWCQTRAGKARAVSGDWPNQVLGNAYH